MALGGLVSYGSSDESDYSDEDDENEPKIVINTTKTEQTPAVAPKAAKPAEISQKLPAPKITLNKVHLEGPATSKASISDDVSDDIDISDEEEDHHESYDPGTFFDEPEPDLISLISKKLPHAKPQDKINHVDLKEDLSTIPAKKDYGEKPELPPARKKEKGPAKISIPRLADLKDEEDEESPPAKKPKPSEKGSGLFAVLPDPKNKVKDKRNGMFLPNSVLTKKPNIPTDGYNVVKNNLKPSGARTVGMVPNRVDNPGKKAPANNSDSDSEDDLLGVRDVSSSYFPEPRKPHPSAPPGSTLHLPRVNTAPTNLPRVNMTPSASSSSLPRVNMTPSASSLPRVNMTPEDTSGSDHRPLNFRAGFNKPRAPRPPPSQAVLESNFLSLDASSEIEHGPATAPYPPPAPGPSASVPSGIDSEEAMRKLAGKQNRLKEEKFDIIDINEDDMKGDPRTWLTKAMTEEEAPRPSGTGPKGLAKSRHQITYLAHMAKEREWELKQEWSAAAHNKRASMNKYGFI